MDDFGDFGSDNPFERAAAKTAAMGRDIVVPEPVKVADDPDDTPGPA